MITGIVCCARDWGIGKKNGLLFNIEDDMKYFKEHTTGCICVFGYNTYMSLPKRPLPNRINVVLWDQATSPNCLEGAITFKEFDALLNFVQIMSTQYIVYICGGATIYKLFLPYYDEICLTKVYATDPEATAFFDLSEADFVSDYASPILEDKKTGLCYRFIHLLCKADAKIFLQDFPDVDLKKPKLTDADIYDEEGKLKTV